MCILYKYTYGGHMEPKTSESMRKAIAKYQKEKMDTITFRVPKGQKQIIQDFAKSQGKSLNAFVVDLINKAMEK